MAFGVAIRWGAVGTLVVTSLGIMGSPGPATMSLTGIGSAYGMRRSVGYLVGIIAGSTVVLLAVAVGIAVTLMAVPAMRAVLLAISAGYLLWLAYHIATAPPLADGAAASSRAPSLAGGLLFGVANPKAWVAIAAVFAGARLAEPPTTDTVAKVVALTLMIVLINTTWLVAGASLAPLFRDPRRARSVNLALAAAVVGAAAMALLH